MNALSTTSKFQNGRKFHSHVRFLRQARDDGSPLLDTKTYKYSSLIGALLYLTNCTRPDLALIVNSLAKYMACPTTKHWHVALEVIRHLSSTINDGIVYSMIVMIVDLCPVLPLF